MADTSQTTLESARGMADRNEPLPEDFYIDANGIVQWKTGRRFRGTTVPRHIVMLAKLLEPAPSLYLAGPTTADIDDADDTWKRLNRAEWMPLSEAPREEMLLMAGPAHAKSQKVWEYGVAWIDQYDIVCGWNQFHSPTHFKRIVAPANVND